MRQPNLVARTTSDTVLDALALALRLDEAEHAHLRNLVRTAHHGAARRAPYRPPGPNPCAPPFSACSTP